MKNKELSGLFTEIAELLSLGDENIFKIRAYERAAQVISALPDPIEDIAARGKLLEIPGIGAGIAEKINDYLSSGKIPYLDELKKIFPQGLLDIMSVQGMGPKKAKILFDKLNIDGIPSLEKAAKEGKIRGLPGFGEKTEENILKGIALRKSFGGRILLDEALNAARSVISELKRNKYIKRISPAGSLRRFKETIGDIDILCSVVSNTEKHVVGCFTKLKNVKRVLAAGDTKGSIITDEGIQVDLRVVEDESFGAALQYFTGSKEHNVALRGFARDKGLTINEYGVFKISDKKKAIASKTEEDVYKSLGLPYIPPALREDRGELEAALHKKLPKLIELKDIKGDFHVHSTYSDGSHTIAEIAERAREAGYEWIVITDHSQSLKVARGLSSDILHKKIKEIEHLNKKLKGFRVLCGTEVDIHSDGSLDYPDEILKQLDWVIASVHTGFKQSEEQITNRIISALRNPYVNCIGHLTGRLINEREGYAVNVEKVLEAAKETGKLLEINSYPQRLDLYDIYCRKAKEMGVRVAIGTDSHSVEQFPNMELGVAVAQRGWMEKKDVLNTLTLHDLFKYLNK
ncbi:MAG: DNA polymerase/3'-5' exonuclease PolX [Elusimicrobiota bacterium]